jgi:hypothetical protein
MPFDFTPKPNDYILQECVKGNIEAIEKYLNEGHDLLHKNCFKDSLISMAAKAKQFEVIDYLLGKGYPKYDIDGDRYHFIHYLIQEEYCLDNFIELVKKHDIDLNHVNQINRGGLIREAISNKCFNFVKYFCEKTNLDIYEINQNEPKTLDAFQAALISNQEIALYIYENYDFELTDKLENFTQDIKKSEDLIPEYHIDFKQQLNNLESIKTIKKEQRLLNATIHENSFKKRLKV